MSNSDDRKNSVVRGIETFAAAIGGVTGLLALCIVVWKGGQLSQVIVTHETRIGAIEQAGTFVARAHVQADDERDKAMAAQITELRGTLNAVVDMRVDVRVMREQIATLAKSFEEHKLTKP